MYIYVLVYENEVRGLGQRADKRVSQREKIAIKIRIGSDREASATKSDVTLLVNPLELFSTRSAGIIFAYFAWARITDSPREGP